MGFQFIHLETYSRKPDKHGRSVDYVLDEACRNADASLHIENPKPPELVHGIPLSELREVHAARAGAALYPGPKGTLRKIRSDQKTLVTIVASHPGGPDGEVAAWEARTVEWLRLQYGDDLATVIRHTDEGRPHLHAYVLPSDSSMKGNLLHPGWVAKDVAKRQAMASGDDPKTVGKRANRAYRAAMRGWQDAYWESVGLPSGLARIGPGRRRQSRPEWMAEQEQVRRAAALLDLVAQLETRAGALQAGISRGEALASALGNQVQQGRQELHALQRAAEAARRQADAVVSKARKQAAVILAKAGKEADRLRGVGAVLGGFVQGVLGASPSKVADLVREEERQAFQERESDLLSTNKAIRKEMRDLARERDEVRESLGQAITERDNLLLLNRNPHEALAPRHRSTVQ